ncbi:hypothetical protein [Shewanella salipaludis]|uniref:Uncharacterized protein n=1 Tax=Shewanella salipaludis TaxID=2723052 RepID=A0A972JP52_9GAMM|nr:hypothetical protein [Shewanella salipaludis]NMH66831.1 hypothetical protein [Shewanella salipaludis]
MKARNSKEPDSSLSTLNHYLTAKLQSLVQFTCFWLLLSSYIFPLCKQKLTQTLTGIKEH